MTTELGIQLPAPEVTEHEVAALVSALRELGGWHNARELVALGYEERKLRAIAEHSDGQIISGQRGYALMSNCTPAEIDRSASWLESQGKKMLTRAAKIRVRFHRYGAQLA
jgi:hypothetical protein